MVREILADTDTPVSAYLKIAHGTHAFLLESVESGEKWSRYSILGADPATTYFAQDGRVEFRRPGKKPRVIAGETDPLRELERWIAAQRPVEIEGLPPFWGGAVGFVGYDAVRAFERLPVKAKDDLRIPDAVFMLCDTVVVFDNLTRTMKVITSRPGDGDPETTYHECVAEIDALIAKLQGPLPPPTDAKSRRAGGRFSSTFSKVGFKEAVSQAKEHIRAGDAVQIVLAQRFEKKLGCDPFDLYRALRVINPSSYMFYLKMGEHKLAGSSPEVLVRVTGEDVELRPIAGTRPRRAARGGSRSGISCARRRSARST